MAEESAPELIPLANPRRNRLTPGSLAAKEPLEGRWPWTLALRRGNTEARGERGAWVSIAERTDYRSTIGYQLSQSIMQ